MSPAVATDQVLLVLTLWVPCFRSCYLSHCSSSPLRVLQVHCQEAAGLHCCPGTCCRWHRCCPGRSSTVASVGHQGSSAPESRVVLKKSPASGLSYCTCGSIRVSPHKRTVLTKSTSVQPRLLTGMCAPVHQAPGLMQLSTFLLFVHRPKPPSRCCTMKCQKTPMTSD